MTYDALFVQIFQVMFAPSCEYMWHISGTSVAGPGISGSYLTLGALLEVMMTAGEIRLDNRPGSRIF